MPDAAVRLAPHWQFIRYAATGLLLNGMLYAAYLGLTAGLLGSRAAMTVTYGAGVLMGFVLNGRFAFRGHGAGRGALRRYIVSYLIGYIVNFLALWLLVDRAGLPHRIVQGIMILVLAFLLFALQRYWVFAAAPLRSAS